MTTQGVQQLYMYLGAAWPQVVRPGIDEAWKRAKLQELYQTYRHYEDEEVQAAFMAWTEANDKWPTTKNIITEIKWARVKKAGRDPEDGKLYQMPIMLKNGTESVVMVDGKINFTWDEFVNVPRNKEHLTPDEWEKRFVKWRRQVLSEKKEAKA